MHTDKPTWLMDQPGYPLDEGHISYNDRIADLLSNWEHIDLDEGLEEGDDPSGDGIKSLTLGQEGNSDAFENQAGEVDTSASDKKKKRGRIR